MCYISFAFQAESPTSGTFTALGIYLCSCMLFVVAAFIEFAVLLVLQNSYDTRRRQRARMRFNKVNRKAQENYDEEFPNVIYKIDMVSLFVIAFIFALFNLLYWSKFTNWQ